MKLVYLCCLVVGLGGGTAYGQMSGAIPAPAGVVTVLPGPVSMALRPTAREAKAETQSEVQVTSNGQKRNSSTSSRVRVQAQSFGDDLQVTYVIDESRSDAGKTDKDMVVQMRFPKGRRPAKVELGGEMVRSMPAEARTATAAMFAALPEGVSPATGESMVSPGEVVQSFDLVPMLNSFLANGRDADKFKDITSAKPTGPGVHGRLSGETVRGGRRSYVVTYAGSDQIKGAFGVFSFSMAGYALVDAETGLYSERRTVSVTDLKLSAGGESVALQFTNRERFDLKF
ncbi:hypothetical protein [Luteitalea sp.]